MQKRGVQSLDREDPLEEEMATHCYVLIWEVPWTEEPGGLQSVGLQKVGQNLETKQQQKHVLSSTVSIISPCDFRTMWMTIHPVLGLSVACPPDFNNHLPWSYSRPCRVNTFNPL